MVNKYLDNDYHKWIANVITDICNDPSEISILKKQILTLCRIPSSKKDKVNGCDDLIEELCKLNPEFINGSKSIQRTKDIKAAHLGGKRDMAMHQNTSIIKDINPFTN